MDITAAGGQRLCDSIIDRFMEMGMLLPAILQSAGCERKTEGSTQLAINAWLSHERPDLICIPEYKFGDFAIVTRASIGSPNLIVDSIIEAKFNYAVQIGEITRRAPLGLTQVTGYAAAFTPKPDPYLLYVIANHVGRMVERHGNYDEGWRYMRRSLEQRTLGAASQILLQRNPIAYCTHDFGDWEIFCSLHRPGPD